MSVVPNWVILVVTVAVFSIAFGGTYYLGRSAGSKAAELKHSKEVIVSLEDAAKRERLLRIDLEAERARLRDVSGKLQDALQNNSETGETNVQYITTEIEKPVYRDTRLPASGVSVLSESAQRLNATRSAKD